MGLTEAVTQPLASPFSDSPHTASRNRSKLGSFGQSVSSNHLSSFLSSHPMAQL